MTLGKLGKLVPPYPISNCVVDTCNRELSEVEGVYVFQDLKREKLVIVCGVCAANFELNHRDRFMLVPL